MNRLVMAGIFFLTLLLGTRIASSAFFNQDVSRQVAQQLNGTQRMTTPGSNQSGTNQSGTNQSGTNQTTAQRLDVAQQPGTTAPEDAPPTRSSGYSIEIADGTTNNGTTGTGGLNASPSPSPATPPAAQPPAATNTTPQPGAQPANAVPAAW